MDIHCSPHDRVRRLRIHDVRHNLDGYFTAGSRDCGASADEWKLSASRPLTWNSARCGQSIQKEIHAECMELLFFSFTTDQRLLENSLIQWKPGL